MTKVVTANRLADGAIVYLAGSDTWSTRLDEAAVAADEATAAALLAAAERAVAACQVVAAYAFPVAVADGRPVPIDQRERVRAAGPSVASDFRD